MPAMLRWVVVLFLALVPVRAVAARLSAVERRAAAAVDRHTPLALELLKRVVEVNSGTMNFDGVRAVGHMLQPELESLGFTVRWVDGAAWGRAGHLVAERSGRPGALRVLLIGHLDTVFERDSPFQHFEPVSDSAARGPGVIDMKGGDVVALLALRALAEAGTLDRFAVTVVFTGDEESPGEPIELARRDLRAAAERADVALGFEDGDGSPARAIVARRGSSGWRLGVWGQPAHSSQVFRADVGSGAIYEASRILSAFRDSLSGEAYLTANPGVIVGGTSVALDGQTMRGAAFGKANVIAESTLVEGDLRTLSPEQLERARATMRRIVAASPPHARATIAFDDGYPPMPPSDGNRRLLAAIDGASRDLGFGPVGAVDPARAGAADVSFVADRVPMVLDALGVKGTGGHTIGETGDPRTLPMQAKRTAVALLRLAREPRGGRR